MTNAATNPPDTVEYHRTNLHHHARMRVWSRYGLCLGGREIETLVSLIVRRRSCALRVWSQSSDRSIWAIMYKGRLLYVVFDAKLQAIATFLTEDMVRKTHPEAMGPADDPLAVARQCRDGLYRDGGVRRRIERGRDFQVPQEWLADRR